MLGAFPSHQWDRAGLDGTSGERFPLWPSLAAQLLCSRSRGVARRVWGAAGGAEARAGWGTGRASARAVDLACPKSKLVNLRPEEKYKHTFSHKLATHLAGI